MLESFNLGPPRFQPLVRRVLVQAIRRTGDISIQCDRCHHTVDFASQTERDRFMSSSSWLQFKDPDQTRCVVCQTGPRA